MELTGDNSIIEIRDFSFAYAAQQVLDGVCLSVRRGEYVSMVGPNGAGKTTLLKCLMRILPGGTGHIAVNGKALGRYSQKELAALVSYVPQHMEHVFPFTVREFVMMARYPHISPFTSFGSADKKAVSRALALTGTDAWAERGLNTLSGGERQKVLIASALAQEAAILLLDEPATFLDPRYQEDIQDILDRVNRQSGVTVVTATHDINRAALHSSRIIGLKNGRVAFCGPPGELMTYERLENLYDTSFHLVAHPAGAAAMIVPGRREHE